MPDQDRVEFYELDQYVYDRRTGRFHGPLPSYRIVSRATIMGLIQERIDFHTQEVTRLTQALIDRRIDLATWERGVAQELKDLYLQQAALARGGWQNLTAADRRRVTLLPPRLTLSLRRDADLIKRYCILPRLSMNWFSEYSAGCARRTLCTLPPVFRQALF